MIYVYRDAPSNGARLLADALPGARRIRDIERIYNHRLIQPEDTVVCWGSAWRSLEFPHWLNNAPMQNKFQDALALAAAQVPTIQVARIRPVNENTGPDPALAAWARAMICAEDFVGANFSRSEITMRGIRELEEEFSRLHDALSTPLPTMDDSTWLGRSRNHVGGADLLNPPAQVDYYVKKESLVREFRVHSFDGVSIRAGVKTHRDGVAQPHPWVRSWDGGWRISYDGHTIRQAHRELAARAVRALNLTFGAVDIGERHDGTSIVLEVNRAPGLEGGTISAYAQAINRWIAGRG